MTVETQLAPWCQWCSVKRNNDHLVVGESMGKKAQASIWQCIALYLLSWCATFLWVDCSSIQSEATDEAGAAWLSVEKHSTAASNTTSVKIDAGVVCWTIFVTGSGPQEDATNTNSRADEVMSQRIGTCQNKCGLKRKSVKKCC